MLVSGLLGYATVMLSHKSSHNELSYSASPNDYGSIKTAELKQVISDISVRDSDQLSIILVTKRTLTSSEYNLLRSLAKIKANTSRVYALSITKKNMLKIEKMPFTLYLDWGLKEAQINMMDTVITTRTNYAYYIMDATDNNITGKGVRVGIIDTGIDWRHPFFYYNDGLNYTIINNTHVELDGALYKYYVLDVVSVTPAAQGAPSGDFVQLIPDGIFNLGYEYLYVDIDGDTQPDVDPDNPNIIEYGILRDLDKNGFPSPGDIIKGLRTPKIAKILDERTTPYKVYVSGINMSQYDPVDLSGQGHGAHVAGIILGGHTTMKLHGIAPDAEIYVVANGGYFTYENVIYGMQWLAEQNVSVINMSFGGTKGYLDGTDPWDIAIDDLFRRGIVSVVSAGNLVGRNHHIMTEIPAYSTVDLTFNTHYLNIFINILWREPWADLEFTLISPYGQKYDLGTFSNPLSVTEEGIDVSTESSMSPRYTSQFLISIYDLTPLDGAIWTLRVRNPSDRRQKIHGYLMWSVYNTWNPPYISDSFTINSPATADSAMCVGALTKMGYLASYSSLGPRIDGVNKPDICAPGGYSAYGYDNPYILSVNGEVSIPGQPPYTHGHSEYAYMCGTSMAAPHITGFIALLLQQNPLLSPIEIKEMLHLSAGYTHFLPYKVYPMPDNRVGYGGIGYITISQLQTDGDDGPGPVTVTSWYPSGFIIAHDEWLSGSKGIFINGDDRDWLLYYPVIIHNDSRSSEEYSFKLYSWHENASHIFFYMKFRVNYALTNYVINVYIGRDRPGFIGSIDQYLPDWRITYNTSSGASTLELWNSNTNSYSVMPAGGFYGVMTGFSSIDGNWLIEFYVKKNYIEMQNLSEAIIYFAVYDLTYTTLLNNNDPYDRPGASFYASIDQSPVVGLTNATYIYDEHKVRAHIETDLNDYWSDVISVSLLVTLPSNTSIVIPMKYNSISGLWEASYNITPENQSIGIYENLLIIYDDLGAKTLVNSLSTVVFTLIDNEAPSISLEVSSYVTGLARINWTVTESNLDELILRIDTNEYNVLGTNSFLWNTTQYNDGNHTISLYAKDKGGLESELIKSVIVDNTPPEVSILSPINETITSLTSVLLMWSVYDISGIVGVNISLDGEVVATLPAAQDSYTLTNLVEGTRTIEVKVWDIVGLITTQKVIITVDLSPPTITIISPSNGSEIYKDSVMISWSASDNVGLDHFEVYLDGELIIQSIPADWRSINITELSLGEHTVMIKAYDKVGNSAECTTTFIYHKIEVETPPIVNYIYLMIGFAIGCIVAVIIIKILKK